MIIDFKIEMFNPRLVHAVACLQLDAFKLFPLDQQARESYFFKKYIRFLREIGKSENIEHYLDYILGIDRPLNSKAIHKSGYVAGSILIHLLAMHQQGHKPILEKAKYMFQEWNIKADRQSLSGYKSKTSLRSIEGSWHDYKSVAHLWAVDILMFENEIVIDKPLHYKSKLTATENIYRDSRFYLAHIKAMEKKLVELGLKNFDFVELPNFPIGFVVENLETQWSNTIQDIFSSYTHISSKKIK